jgi:uncharacterized protein (DUF2141 family)
MTARLIFILVLAVTAPEQPRALVVTIGDIRPAKGALMIGLFNNAGDFPSKASHGKIVPVTASSLDVVFEGLEPGQYAISVVHDANNNGKMDTNAIGLPVEGFAFGNNAMGLLGLPSYRKASVNIGDERVHHILAMRYY